MDYKNNKILITGGTGFLGANLVNCLLNEKGVSSENIRIFYLEDSPTMALDDFPGLDMFPGNVLDKESLRNACEGMDYCFHTVGNTSFEPRVKKIQWLVNVEGVRNLLEVVKESKTIKRVCYTSTVNSMGVPNPLGSTGTIETSNPYTNEPSIHSFKSSQEVLEFADSIFHNKAPKKWWKQIGICYYDSKLAAQELINRAVSEDNLDIVSVLPGTFFGPYDVFIGNGLYLIRIYKNKMPGVLKGGLPLTHVSDIVNGHMLAMEKGKKGERYIIVGEENYYLKEMAKVIAYQLQELEPDKKIKNKFKVFSKGMAKIGARFSELYAKVFKKPCVLSVGMVEGGSQPMFYSYEKAEREFGYKPQKTFVEAVVDMYHYYKKINYFEKKGRETL